MDLVISVDTAIAHLAGSLDKSLFLLLPFNADYRWMLYKLDSPWYPKATLLRQSHPGNWDQVISETKRQFTSWETRKGARQWGH
jgi:ADP-heptose:LPS heptosyltransferase